jgi:hypothetical protein
MKLKLFAFAVALLGAAGTAFATDGWTNATVTSIQAVAGTSGYVEVQFSVSNSGGPSCASSYKSWAVIDVTNQPGQFAASVLQAARLTGATVSATGTGSCSPLNGGIEALEYVSE